VAAQRDINSVRMRSLLLLTLAGVLVILAYARALNGPFVFDDHRNISDNAHIRLRHWTSSAILDAAFKSPAKNRPVANISFALNYAFRRLDRRAMRVVNILIHLANAAVLYFFLEATLATPALHEQRNALNWLPAATALVWALHPLHTESVSYIVQRMTSMAALFYMLSLLCYAKARLATKRPARRMLYALCIFSGLLALGSKEISAMVPLFILLYEWFFFQSCSAAWLKKKLGIIVLSLSGGLLLCWVFLGSRPVHSILNGYTNRSFTLDERLLTEPRVVLHYISLLLLPTPSRLNLDIDFPLSHSLLHPPATLFAMVVIGGLLVLAVCMARRHPLPAFCLFWFFGNLVIESSVIPLEIIFEHRTYLPSMLGIVPPILGGGYFLHKKWVRTGLLCAVVALLTAWTYQRNAVWADDVALWQDCTLKSPHKVRPHYNLGNALAAHGKIQAAMHEYHLVLKQSPVHAKARNNLGNLLYGLGRFQEAAEQFRLSTLLAPRRPKAYNNLGKTYTRLDRMDAAIAQYRKALELNPNYAKAHKNLGDALCGQKHRQAAIRHYRAALRINPHYTSARRNLMKCRAARH